MNNIVPKEFFIAKGSGTDQFQLHAGSFHKALYQAGIANYNICYYSSVLAQDYRLIEKPREMPFGSELKTIMSRVDSDYSESNVLLQSGIIYAPLYEKGKKIGGLVCEITNKALLPILAPLNLSHSEWLTEQREKFNRELTDTLFRMHKATHREYDLGQPDIVTNDFPKKEQGYATCLTAMCFISYSNPIYRVDW